MHIKVFRSYPERLLCIFIFFFLMLLLLVSHLQAFGPVFLWDFSFFFFSALTAFWIVLFASTYPHFSILPHSLEA